MSLAMTLLGHEVTSQDVREMRDMITRADNPADPEEPYVIPSEYEGLCEELRKDKYQSKHPYDVLELLNE